MVFENKNSHWIDAYTRKFEESFKSINLLDKKKEYWRFASPSIWHDKLPIKKFQETKSSQSLKFDVTKYSFLRGGRNLNAKVRCDSVPRGSPVPRASSAIMQLIFFTRNRKLSTTDFGSTFDGCKQQPVKMFWASARPVLEIHL